MPDEPLPMSVFYDLMLADRAVGQLMRLALADSGLTPLEYGIYSALIETPGVTATGLAAEMHAPLTTMADWLAKPLRRGHVVRSRLPEDRRAWALRLTAQGVEAHELGRAGFAAAYVRYMELPGVDVDAQHVVLESMRNGALTIARELGAVSESTVRSGSERIDSEIGE